MGDPNSGPRENHVEEPKARRNASLRYLRNCHSVTRLWDLSSFLDGLNRHCGFIFANDFSHLGSFTRLNGPN